MKYIKITWIRILVSLFTGSVISELIHISTGDPNRPRGGGGSLVTIIAALIVYLLLTNLVKKDVGGRRLK
jgi:hypothetical protein